MIARAHDAFSGRWGTAKLEVGSEPPFMPFNPSVFVDEHERIFCCIRWANYMHSGAPPGGVTITRNEIVELSIVAGRISVHNRRRLQNEDTHVQPLSSAWIRGCEDLRIFRWNGRWLASATVCDRRSDHVPEMAILELDINDHQAVVRRVHPQRRHRPEKNWVPLPLTDGRLFFVHHTSDPTTILQFNASDGSCRDTMSTKPRCYIEGDLRGSSQAVPFERGGQPGYLYVVHEAHNDTSGLRRSYTHRLVWMNERFRVSRISKPFYFIQPNTIEFCAGLSIWRQKYAIFSYGIGDSSAYVSTTDREAVTRWLDA